MHGEVTVLRIRSFEPRDIDEVRRIHDRYYSEWEFPDFLNKCVCSFIIEDDDEEIVIAGGIRAIAETVLVTNQNQSRIKIGRSLKEAQHFSLYICEKHGLDELHAFVNNDDYSRHLLRHGFTPRSRALSMKVSNGSR